MRSNRCHHPTSQCAEQQVLLSNLAKYCACHEKWHCKISKKISKNRWNVISNTGPIRPWSENENANRNPPRKWGYFARSPEVFSIGKYNILHLIYSQTFSKYCACHEKWHYNFTKYCACHEKCHLNVTKYCTCHEMWQIHKDIRPFETFTFRSPTLTKHNHGSSQTQTILLLDLLLFSWPQSAKTYDLKKHLLSYFLHLRNTIIAVRKEIQYSFSIFSSLRGRSPQRHTISRNIYFQISYT